MSGDWLWDALSEATAIIQKAHNTGDVSDDGLALPLLDQVEAEARLLEASLAEARAEIVRWQEAYGV